MVDLGSYTPGRPVLVFSFLAKGRTPDM